MLLTPADWIALAGVAVVLVPLIIKPLRRPFLWLWRTNVSAPVGHWLRDLIQEQVTPLVKAGSPKVDEIVTDLTDIKSDLRGVHNRLHTLEGSVQGLGKMSEKAATEAVKAAETSRRIEQAVTSPDNGSTTQPSDTSPH
ncbi:MAG TPA: hypothetical protein VNV87_04510 [Acidimicrobiales bacterium]|jgi:hypothetical protein|nr:hypothetical protein [Acidimicrobiales bacterium]